MNCHRARMAIVERELGELTLGFERALADHLESCAECRGHAAAERLLAGELTVLRAAEPPHVDVRVDVMRRIDALPGVDTQAVPQRQLAWASAAAIAAALVVAAGFRAQADALASAGGTAVDGTRAMVSAAGSVFDAIRGLLVLPWKLLASLGDVLAPAFDTADRYQPLLLALILLGLLSMILTIVWVVGHDLGRPWRKRG